jgi:uncharacterized membrane protein YjjP (DUF1212 family)
MEFKAEDVLDVAMEVGVNLLKCGAEIRRVEDTITYISKAYGATEVNVFAIPSLIIATIVFEGRVYTTKVKRNYTVTTDLFRLEKYNKLSRKICREKPSLEKVREEVECIANLKDYNLFILYLGAILSAGCFAIFFGGSIFDGIAAGIVSIFMTAFLRLEVIKFNQFVRILLCSLIGGLFSVIMCWIGIGDNLSYVMGGAIMIVIPGLAIGTSIRDIMSSDVVSGSVRLLEAIVTSAAVAAGFSIFAKIYGGDVTLISNANWAVMLISGGLATIGYGIVFNNKYKHLPVVCVSGVLATLIYLIGLKLSNNSFIGVMCGTIFATLLAELLARILKSPTTVFLIPAIIPFVPGARLFYTMYSLLESDMPNAKANFNELMLASLGIAVGIILASVFAQIVIKTIKKIKTN